jgi:hypothetical protein
MPGEESDMSRLWLLKGPHEAPGWQTLRTDHEEEKVDIVHLDPEVWAVVRSDDAPSGYEGMTASEPPDGIYLDPNGSPLYLAGGQIVSSGHEVIAALGEQAQQMFEEIGDAEMALERLGRAF